MKRCPWVTPHPLYERYHDEEWSVPVHDDRKHFEFLLLESAQAGLNWLTILKRREGYRKAFADFDPSIVATFDEEKKRELLQNPDIIRHEKKIHAAIQNAKAFLKTQEEFGTFDHYVWRFVKGSPLYLHPKTIQELRTISAESIALSVDLKKRGFLFLGPKTLYAYMQAVGLIHEHTQDCFCSLSYNNSLEVKT